MMIMENDEFTIPEQYRKMSIAQIDRETEKVLEKFKGEPRKIGNKKKASSGTKEISFYL